jgi:hypothetical protein
VFHRNGHRVGLPAFKGEIVMNVMRRVFRKGTDNGGTGGRVRRSLAAVGVAAAAAGLLTVGAGQANASTAFTVHVTPNNTFGLLLDVSGASTSPGAPVIDWWANGGSNQVWTFYPVGNDVYEIANQNSGQCLTTDGIAGHGVFQWPCVGSATQIWSTGLTPTSVSAWTIGNPWSGLYLDVSGNNPWPGTSLDVWYYNGGANQHFAAL